jgi:2-hydroxychromene-2-carboxylate isomerase
MGKRKTVRFYYSVGSRYSYLASTQVGKLERETGCEVLWRPLYSVDLYELRGANPFEGESASGQYVWDYSPGPERRLAETAAEAHSAGTFGVPTFVVDDRMFWGNDRLVLVRHYLKK